MSGLKDPKEWVAKAKELEYSSLGICEKQTLGSTIRFQGECISKGIKPILGMEVVVFSTTDKELRKDAVKIGHLLLYAKNEAGWKNLIKINNFSYDGEGGRYYTPRVDIEFLSKASEGVICVTPSVGGVGTKVSEKLFKLSHEDQLNTLSEIYGEDFYVGVNPVLPEESKYWQADKALLKTDFQKVLTFNAHYPDESLAHLYEVVRAIDNGAKVRKNYDREVINGHLPAKTLEISEEYHEAENNLQVISDKVDYLIPLGTYYMPEVMLETGSLESDILKFIGEGFKNKLCPEAAFEVLTDFDILYEYGELMPFRLRGLENSDLAGTFLPLKDYIDRLKYEYNIIKNTGFLDYFHIIYDLCRNVPDRGEGRGSAAGSLVAYLLNIVGADPIYHGLLFERFLNPDRKDLPDIDIDFSQASIVQAKKYLNDRYGEGKVFPILTYGRMKIASAIKKIAAAYAYSIPDNNGDFIQYDAGSLNAAIKVDYVNPVHRGQQELEDRLGYAKFEEFYNRHSNWFDEIIMPLQEAITGPGIHAAGSIVINEDRDDCLPVEHNSNWGGFVTQWVDKDCEKRGYPKFDLLTIKALDVVNYAKKIIFEEHGVKIPDMHEIPLNDPLTLAMFSEGFTGGIFQYNTFTQRTYLPDFKPESFEDLVACLAVRRPGTMIKDIDQEFSKAKNGLIPISYDHPDLEEILKETYGFMVYQEDMMKIVQKIGGMTPAQAEYVRKACGKKLIEEMRSLRDTFVEGSIKLGYEEEFSVDMWSKIEDFAEYSFNKSHSVAYTLLSYYQAYIKSRYPTEYWCAALQYSSDDEDSDSGFIKMKYEAVSEGIEFVYPTIKKFAIDFRPAEEYKIIWPLGKVKGIGDTALGQMSQDGRRSFTGMEQMFEICSRSKLRSNNYEALISAGFFDPLYRPWQASELLYDILKKDVPYSMSHTDVYEWVLRRNAAFGMIVKSWKEIFPFHPNVRSYKDTELADIRDGEEVFVGGYVKVLKIRKTKNGKYYARATLVDEGEEHVVFFWSKFWENSDLDRVGCRPEQGTLIELIGVKGSFNDRPQIGVNNPGDYVRIIRD
jgi:DNA polymerase-3 subunit alpha